MKLTRTAIFSLTLSVWAAGACAADSAHFERCVVLKDMTFALAEQADKGASRESLKEKVAGTSARNLVDFVFDFRLVKTNKELAAKIMAVCLEESGLSN